MMQLPGADTMLLLGEAALAMLVLCTAVGFALHGMERRGRVTARVGAVVAPHRPARGPVAARARFGFARWLPARFDGMLGWFGIRRSEAEMHRIRWPLALLLGLALARLGAGLLAVIAGDVVLLGVPLLWVVIVRGFMGWCRDRHLATLYRQFPDALAMIVRAVRVGIPVSESLRTVAREAPQPTAAAFARVADRIVIGVPVEEALQAMAQHSGLPEYRFFATALALQAQTGGALSEALENLAEVIRRRVALRARAHALASEARASAGVLMALPVIAGLALLVVSPAYVKPLFFDPTGQKILGAAVLLLGLGALVMRSMIRRSLS